MTTRDGEKIWSHTGSSPGLTGPYVVRQMMVDRSDGSLLAFLSDNAIVRSTDEGKTWRIMKDDCALVRRLRQSRRLRLCG